MKEYYTKQEIEAKMLKSSGNYQIRIYDNLQDLMKKENFVNQDYKNISEYTNGYFPFDDAICYFIEGNIAPDNKYDKEVLFINYNENNIPTNLFLEDAHTQGLKEIFDMIKISIEYLQNNDLIEQTKTEATHDISELFDD